MNKETLEALKGSIEKWRKIVEEGDEDRGSSSCPLCQLFLLRDDVCTFIVSVAAVIITLFIMLGRNS